MYPLRFPCRGRIVFLFSLPLLLAASAVHAQNLNETMLHSFATNATDGRNPSGDIIQGQDGSLYGTANGGGTNGYGILFQIDRNGANYHVVRNFAYSSGAYPSGLVQGTNGILYGTVSQGGSNAYGAVFELNTNGAGYAQLHAFSQSDGIYPDANALSAGNGVFFGCTSQGGISNAGTLFRIDQDGGGFQVLRQFTNSDGAGPVALTLGRDGALYGITSYGGSSNAGTVFKMNTNGNNYTILRNFTNSPDGFEPTSLIQGKDDMLYGTTVFGGSAYMYGGTLFKMDTNGGSYAIMHSFPTTGDDGINPDAVIQGTDSFLYGTVGNGGRLDYGAVFKTDTNAASFSVVFSFGNSPDGKNPSAPLLEAGDGAFYGTTGNGGTNGLGTVFRLAPPLLLSSQVSISGGTNTAILFWPAWASDYGVRTSPILNSNATWTALAAPVTIGNKLYTTNKSTASNAFFRLQSPP